MAKLFLRETLVTMFLRTFFALIISYVAFANEDLGSKCHVGKNGFPNYDSKIDLELKPGDYVRVSYIRNLYSTHSSLSYSQHNGLQAASVRADKDGRSAIMFIWNFHEGDINRTIKSDGSMRRVDGVNEERIIIQKSSESCFKVSYPDTLAGEFARIDSFDEIAREATVAGTYFDSSGRRYIFRKNGEAIFPGRVFKYNVSLDHAEQDFDFIYNGNIIWKYEWKGRKLLLTKTEDEEPNRPLGRPFLILTRVGN